MASIPNSFIESLLSQSDIVEVIDSWVPLRKKGKYHVACCPFHQESTPSFTVNFEKQFYYCFGCKAGGNVISFVMAYERVNFVEAIELLAARLNLTVPKEGLKQFRPAKKEWSHLMEDVMKFYQSQLKGSLRAAHYLEQRGISKELIQDFNIGFAPASWDALSKHLTSSFNYSLEELKSMGLIVQRTNNTYYDRFRNRILFPIRDRRGRCIGFGGRVLDATHSPKYLNSPETFIFHKNTELYGLYEASQKCRTFDRIWIVEGYMDVLALHQAGIPQVVATLGTATSRTHLLRLFELTKEIVFCFDGDHAGRQAAWRALEISLSVLRDDCFIRFLFLPKGEDPDSWVRHKKKPALNELVHQALSLKDFLFKHLSQSLDLKTTEGKSRLAHHVLPLLNKVSFSVMREALFEELSHWIHLDVNLLKKLSLRHVKEKLQGTPSIHSYTVKDRAIGFLLQSPHLVHLLDDQARKFILPHYPLFSQLVTLIDGFQKVNTAILLERFRDQPSEYSYLLRLAQHDFLVPTEGIEEEFRDILIHLNKSIYEYTIEHLLEKSRSTPLSIEEKKRLVFALTQNKKSK